MLWLALMQSIQLFPTMERVLAAEFEGDPVNRLESFWTQMKGVQKIKPAESPVSQCTPELAEQMADAAFTVVSKLRQQLMEAPEDFVKMRQHLILTMPDWIPLGFHQAVLTIAEYFLEVTGSDAEMEALAQKAREALAASP